MKEPVKKTIDGEQYTICLLPASQGWNLLIKILRFLGAPIGLGISNNLSVDMTVSDIFKEINIGKVIAELCSRLNEEEADCIVKTLFSQVMVKNKGNLSDVFEEHFAGRYLHMLKVVGASLEVNYGDFFGGKLDLQNILKGRAITPDSQT